MPEPTDDDWPDDDEDEEMQDSDKPNDIDEPNDWDDIDAEEESIMASHKGPSDNLNNLGKGYSYNQNISQIKVYTMK